MAKTSQAASMMLAAAAAGAPTQSSAPLNLTPQQQAAVAATDPVAAAAMTGGVSQQAPAPRARAEGMQPPPQQGGNAPPNPPAAPPAASPAPEEPKDDAFYETLKKQDPLAAAKYLEERANLTTQAKETPPVAPQLNVPEAAKPKEEAPAPTATAVLTDQEMNDLTAAVYANEKSEMPKDWQDKLKAKGFGDRAVQFVQDSIANQKAAAVSAVEKECGSLARYGEMAKVAQETLSESAQQFLFDKLRSPRASEVAEGARLLKAAVSEHMGLGGRSYVGTGMSGNSQGPMSAQEAAEEMAKMIYDEKIPYSAIGGNQKAQERWKNFLSRLSQ